MISVVTAVHNQLDMNKLFTDKLKEYTRNEYELIVIDNNSTDGSREYFKNNADKVILNDGNYSYPHCQNQGIEKSQYKYIAFLNNDIIVSPDWDEKLIEIMEDQKFDIISPASNDRLETPYATKKIRRKWKLIKNPFLFIFGSNRINLKIMHSLMYGNWQKFTENRYNQFEHKTMEGFSGSCLIFKKEALSKIGLWDEKIQSADFDLFNRVKVRSLQKRDIKPINIALGVYFHHYTRLTFRREKTPFIDGDNLIAFEEKWGDQTKELMKDIAK